MIYFIKAVHSNAIKIGFSNDPKGRLASLQTGSAEPLELLGVIPGQIPDEKRLHSQFAKYRMAGEWFKGDPELVRAINAMFPPSLSDLLVRACPHFWMIDGIAQRESENDRFSIKLFCILRNKPAFPDPDEMLSAVHPNARFFLGYEVSMIPQECFKLEDTENVRRVLSDKEFAMWVCIDDGGFGEFHPVLPREIRQAEILRPQAHPTDSLVAGSGVLHPQYGIGQVIAIDGPRPDRKARIRFKVGGEKTFVLAKSPLRQVALPTEHDPEPETKSATELWRPRWMNPLNS